MTAAANSATDNRGARAVLSDDGHTISLATYGDDSALVVVTLAPMRALTLAVKLIEAAIPKLSMATTRLRRRT